MKWREVYYVFIVSDGYRIYLRFGKFSSFLFNGFTVLWIKYKNLKYDDAFITDDGFYWLFKNNIIKINIIEVQSFCDT